VVFWAGLTADFAGNGAWVGPGPSTAAAFAPDADHATQAGADEAGLARGPCTGLEINPALAGGCRGARRAF
jgi:hypothetical protein